MANRGRIEEQIQAAFGDLKELAPDSGFSVAPSLRPAEHPEFTSRLGAKSLMVVDYWFGQANDRYRRSKMIEPGLTPENPKLVGAELEWEKDGLLYTLAAERKSREQEGPMPDEVSFFQISVKNGNGIALANAPYYETSGYRPHLHVEVPGSGELQLGAPIFSDKPDRWSVSLGGEFVRELKPEGFNRLPFGVFVSLGGNRDLPRHPINVAIKDSDIAGSVTMLASKHPEAVLVAPNISAPHRERIDLELTVPGVLDPEKMIKELKGHHGSAAAVASMVRFSRSDLVFG